MHTLSDTPFASRARRTRQERKTALDAIRSTAREARTLRVCAGLPPGTIDRVNLILAYLAELDDAVRGERE